jgi:hypothetical protein
MHDCLVAEQFKSRRDANYLIAAVMGKSDAPLLTHQDTSKLVLRAMVTDLEDRRATSRATHIPEHIAALIHAILVFNIPEEY